MSWVDEAETETKSSKTQNVKDFESLFAEDKYGDAFTTLLYGDSGTGKTFISMTFPEPIFVIDTENRALNTKKYNFKEKDIKIYQPVEFKTDFDPEHEDSIDMYQTIENITSFIIKFATKVKNGEIKQGTLVVDSCTDIWSLCQEWGIYKLAKYINKDGTKKADIGLMKVNNQLDWGIINRRHKEIVGNLKALNKYGINIVFTAKESTPPEYVIKNQLMTTKDKIRAQKDLYFDADVLINLKKSGDKFLAYCEKLSGKKPSNQPIENLDYLKIKEMLK